MKKAQKKSRTVASTKRPVKKSLLLNKNNRLKGPVLAILLVLFAGLGTSYVMFTQAADVFTVYVSPTGVDTNNGLTEKTPILTLTRAEYVIKKSATKANVEVRIKKGTYNDQSTTWDYYIKGRTISFMPSDYQVGKDLSSIDKRPVFNGKGKGIFFKAKSDVSINSNLRFYYLEVTKYSSGIGINGGTKSVNGLRRGAHNGINNNTFRGMYFRELGSKYTPKEGFGGIDLVNSNNNVIYKNTFENLVNTGDSLEESHIHGVYAAHESTGNEITQNTFNNISGYPVNFRNDSNDNNISDNSFTRTRFAAYGEWFADTGSPKECASHNNRLSNNKLGKTNSGGNLLSFRLVISLNNQNYAGSHKDCGNKGQPRVISKNNN